jgi:hypothetical protein
MNNRGRIGERKRSKFAELDDTTVAALEAAVRDAFDIEAP